MFSSISLFLFPQFPKELFHHAAALFLQNPRRQFCLMIKLWYIQQIEYRSRTAGFWIHTSHHHPFDSRLYDCPGTHLAWFQCHIHRTSVQPPVIQFSARLTNGLKFCMRQCIFIYGASIVASSDNLILINDYTPDRHFLQRVCFLACRIASLIYFSSILFSLLCSLSFCPIRAAPFRFFFHPTRNTLYLEKTFSRR